MLFSFRLNSHLREEFRHSVVVVVGDSGDDGDDDDEGGDGGGRLAFRD